MSPPRYPGVRCDVPSHCYQYTFESNTQWSEYYCEGAEIERYFQRVARKFGVYKYIKFKHMLKGGFLSLSTLLEFNLEFDHVLLRTFGELSVSIFIVRVEIRTFSANMKP